MKRHAPTTRLAAVLILLLTVGAAAPAAAQAPGVGLDLGRYLAQICVMWTAWVGRVADPTPVVATTVIERGLQRKIGGIVDPIGGSAGEAVAVSLDRPRSTGGEGAETIAPNHAP